MHSTKLSAFCDKVLEIGWLLAVIVTPLLFNVYSSRVFEPDKLTTLRTIAVIMGAVWLVKYIEELVSGRTELGFDWNTPLVLPSLFTIVIYLLSSALSVTPWVSFLGSYQRLQGTYTTISYIVIFFIILQGLRTRAQLNRLISVMIINSLPISLYGLVQRFGLDPLPWGGDVTTRVASNMGNAIFVAAYLIMIFPLTVGRIAESFQAIMTEEEADWADVPRAAGYIFIAAVQVIAIWFAQSRGPLLGLIAGFYFLFLLLAMAVRNKGGAVVALSIVTIISLMVGFLAVVNIPNGPLESLQNAPWLGRLGSVFDFEGGTGRVRALIWQGMIDLIGPHDPIEYPDGEPDGLNGIVRYLIGYGPESVYVAYNNFYPPRLGHHESRTASPDRSHNETLDSLAITGILGFVAYVWVFLTVFYYAFKWLGLVTTDRDRNLLFGLIGGLSVASVTFFWIWQGPHFFGAALTLGISAGLGIYLALKALLFSIRLLKAQEAHLPPLHPHHFLIISIVSAVMCHFVEINFGIAIASTRTTFWACAAIMVVAGLNMIGEESVAEVKANNGAQASSNTKRRRKRRRNATSSRRQSAGVPPWLWTTLAVALVGGFMLATLSFDFTNNPERLDKPAQIVWRSMTILPNRNSADGCPARWNATRGQCQSPGALLIFGLTWFVSGVIFISEMGKLGAFQGNKGDGSLAGMVYLLVSLVVWLGFALILANQQVAMLREQATTIEDVIDLAHQVAGFLTTYYVLIALVLVAGGGLLLLQARNLPAIPLQPVGAMALIILVTLAIATAVTTNLQPIQADVIYKQASPYEGNQWPVAIAHYEEARTLAPKEDFYYLYLGRAYLEYASSLEGAARENMLRETEQVLLEARALNPLNTDHSANLARMYRRWADFAQDEDQRAELLRRSDQNYAIATTLSPHNVLLWNEWASLLLYMGDVAQAQEKCDRSLELDPEFDETWWKVQAPIHLTQGLTEEAVEDYEQALELRPQQWDAWHQLAQLYLNEGNLEMAASTYEDMREVLDEQEGRKPGSQLTGQYVLLWRQLGTIYAQSDVEKAIAAFEQAVSLAPNRGDVWETHRNLAILYSQVGQIDLALSHAQMALQHAPEDQQPNIQDIVNQLLAAAGGEGAQ